MPKESFADVTKAVNRRRRYADVSENTFSQSNASSLLKDFIDAININPQDYANNSQSTCAIGLFCGEEENYIVLCGQVQDDVRTAIDSACNGLNASTGMEVIYDKINSSSGLHAEMSIVRNWYETVSGAKSDFRGCTAVVCVGKRVCIDCGGLMNSYGIAHASYLRKDDIDSFNYGCGRASRMSGGMWEHPFTGATYSGGKKVIGYNKGVLSLDVNQRAFPESRRAERAENRDLKRKRGDD